MSISIPKFERTPFVGKDKEEITTFQDSVRTVLDTITPKEILSGHLIENVSCLNMATTQIAHKLERSPRGAIVVAQDVFATFQICLNNTIQDNTKFLTVWNTSANNAIISLWIF